MLLIVDQFEELLGGVENDEVRRFFRIMRLGLTAPGSPLLLAATLRSDFLGAFQQCDLRGMGFTSLMLPPMEPEQMSEAIARPAERAGVEIAPKLVRRILAEAGTDDALPLLAFALRTAYERRRDPKRLAADDYERVGGLKGAVEKRLKEILDLEPLSIEDERRLRDSFLRMVRFNDEGQIARRPIAWNTTPVEIRRVLDRLVDARLLVSREVKHERMLDTVHESLFRVWTPLATWIKDNRPFLDWRHRLQGAIDAGALLPDEALPEAERWLADRGESLDDVQRRFIEDSQARRERRLAEAAEIQRREVERERALRQAEETARREAEQRTAEQAEAAKRHQELAEEAQRRLAETYWSGAAKARERNNLADAVHLMALAASVEPDAIKRKNITLGVLDHNRSRFLEALTDGFEAAANLGKSELPLAPDAALSECGRFIVTRLPGDGSLMGNGIVRVWNAGGSSPHSPPMLHDFVVMGATLTRDAERILTWGTGWPALGVQSGQAQLWNVRGGMAIGSRLGHPGGEMKQATFSADETRILTRATDGTARLWDASTGAPLGEPMRHDQGVVFATFVSLHEILTVDGSGATRTWREVDGRITAGDPQPPRALLERYELAAWTGRAVGFRRPENSRDVEFAARLAIGDFLTIPVDEAGITNHNVTRLLTWNEAGNPRLLDAADGRSVGGTLLHKEVLEDVHFSPSGGCFVLFYKDHSVRVWDSRDAQPISGPLRHEAKVTAAVFDPSERLLLTCSEDRTAQLWDCSASEPIVPPMEHPGPVFAASFSPDGSRILTCSADGHARLWNITDSTSRRRLLDHDAQVTGAIQNKAETQILTWGKRTGDSLGVWLWNSAASRLEAGPLPHDQRVDSWHSDSTPIGGARFTRDETCILTWSADGTARVWGIDGAAKTPPMKHTHRMWGASFTRDERRLLTWSRDGTASIWATTDGRPLGRPMKHEKDVLGAIFDREETRVLTWSEDGTARLWRASDGRPLTPPLTHEKPLSGARFTPDGSRILTWAKDGMARLWSATDGSPSGKSMKHEQGINGATFSRDGSRILTWTRFFSAWGRTAGAARIWMADDGEPLSPELMHRAGVTGACFCRNDTRVLTWSEDSTAQLWNAADGSPAAPRMIHGGSVHGAVLSRDHRRVLTWSEDETARLWNVDDGMPSARPMEHQGEVVGADFDEDETRILTWSKDGRVRLWNAGDGRPILRPLALGGAVGGAMFCRRGRAILAWGGEYGAPSAILWTIDAQDDVPPERLVLDVEVVNGTAMDEHANVRFLTRQEWLERCTRRKALDTAAAAL